MKITKNVPTEAGLHAAAATADRTGIDDFRDFAEDRDLFDDTAIDAPDLAILLPKVPDTPMGRAWAAAMTEALALTEADTYRGYDKVTFEDFEKSVVGAINELADTVEVASPLLKDVASAIRFHGYSGSLRDLEDLAEKRAEVTAESIRIRQWSFSDCESHDVSWAHIEHIMPDLRERLTTLLDSLRLNVPAYGPEEVAGASRTPKSKG